MFARLFTAEIQSGKLDDFPGAFAELVLPDVCRQDGFKSVYLMKDADHNKIVALVLWATEADARASLDGSLSQRLPGLGNFLKTQLVAETLEVVLRA